MMRGDIAIGTVNVVRMAAGPLTDKQIAILKTFADQAVIAIENVRLFNETKEALEQQTATSDILRVISGSLTDTQPVFDAIVQSAVRLFNAKRVRLFLVEGDLLRMRARHGPGTFDEDDNNVVTLPLHGSAVGHAVLQCEAIQFPDFEAPGVPAASVARNRAFGIRSTSIAPLIRDGKAIGAITVPRGEPGSLSDKQMALLNTFADQAVIAIENVRLFNETKEALERQTATAEILRVISSSVADTKPVFEKILQSCERLFQSAVIGISVVGADGRLHLGPIMALAGARSIPFSRWRSTGKPAAVRRSSSGRSCTTRTPKGMRHPNTFAASPRPPAGNPRFLRRCYWRIAESVPSTLRAILPVRSPQRKSRCSGPSPIKP
jgi:GAF domain-containing protein